MVTGVSALGRALPVTVITCFLASSAAAQQAVSHEFTVAPANARYEMVQSPIAARWMFRLDRWSGAVDMLTIDSDDQYWWEPTRVVEPAPIPSPASPRFQVFTSGRTAKNTFLIDAVTGRTWFFVTVTRTKADGTSTESYEWHPVK